MWMKDFQLAIRALAKRPGFSGTIVVTLALGIGATTALFGVFRSVFLEPLQLPDPDRLVVVMETAGFGCCGPASGPDYLDWVERNRSFSGMAALNPSSFNLTLADGAEQVYGTRVTASAFDLLRETVAWSFSVMACGSGRSGGTPRFLDRHSRSMVSAAR